MDEYLVDFIFWMPNENSQPSQELDERSRRMKKFNSENEAREYIKIIMSFKENDNWLASIELKKISMKVIKKFI